MRRTWARVGGLAVVAAASWALCAPAGGAAATAPRTWDVARDFSTSINPNGAWTLGWATGRSAPLQPMTTEFPYSGFAVWSAPPGFPSVPTILLNATAGTLRTACCNPIPAGTVAVHPGAGGQEAVLRWTAPSTGGYAVDVAFTGRDTAGTTTDGAVLVNGRPVFVGEVTGYLARQEYNGVLALAAGDTVEARVGFGTDGNYVSDTTGLAFTVTESDSTPPVVTVPGPVTAEATGPGGAPVDYTATASDPDDAAGPVFCDHPSGAVFPLGTTVVTCSSTDTHGNTGTASFTVTVVDTTPPTLAGVPDAISIDATGAGGAVVAWVAPSAVDLVDGSVPVACAPASGSLFAIGDTAVTCTATDAHGNAATGVFSVHVRGAAEQLDALLAEVGGIGPGRSLAAKVRAAIAALAVGDVADACSDLAALAHEAAAQAGRKLTADQAQRIEDAATRIRAVLGCLAG